MNDTEVDKPRSEVGTCGTCANFNPPPEGKWGWCDACACFASADDTAESLECEDYE